jgi:hypothetical protein
MPGFVTITGPSELAFPDYDGNGMFKSLGNILINGEVGMLFIAMHGKPQRLRVNGQSRRSAPRPDHRRAAYRPCHCPSDLSELSALHPDHAVDRSFDLCAAAGLRAA